MEVDGEGLRREKKVTRQSASARDHKRVSRSWQNPQAEILAAMILVAHLRQTTLFDNPVSDHPGGGVANACYNCPDDVTFFSPPHPRAVIYREDASHSDEKCCEKAGNNAGIRRRPS